MAKQPSPMVEYSTRTISWRNPCTTVTDFVIPKNGTFLPEGPLAVVHVCLNAAVYSKVVALEGQRMFSRELYLE